MQQAKGEVSEQPGLDVQRDPRESQGWESPVREEQPQNTGLSEKEGSGDWGEMRLKRPGEVSLWERHGKGQELLLSVCGRKGAADR